MDYQSYVKGVRSALDSVIGSSALLRGPAGLFKSREKHVLCWGILAECNANRLQCPLDSITFHRKGNGSALAVVDGGIDLMRELTKEFPNISSMFYSNSEADPSSGWSKPLATNANLHYANQLVHIVLTHWDAIHRQRLPRLLDISHDNAFPSYHPFEFEQRTLLARFRMNLTHPPHVQFIQKPVFGAFGMLRHMGELAGGLITGGKGSVMGVASRGHERDAFYSAILLSSSAEDVYQHVKTSTNLMIKIPLDHRSSLVWMAEYLEQNVTDPFHEWQRAGRPAYPDANTRQMMRQKQGPHILVTPQTLNTSLISLRIKLQPPWIVLLRICTTPTTNVSNPSTRHPPRPRGVRIVPVNLQEVAIFWTIPKTTFQRNRCIQSFDVFFRAANLSHWLHINQQYHTPFMMFHFAPNGSEHFGVSGDYKVRSLSLDGSRSRFSKICSHG